MSTEHLFKRELRQYQEAIAGYLQQLFKNKRASVQKTAPHLEPLVDQLAEFVLRKDGKRLRGFLFVQGYRLLKKSVPKDILRLSIVPELLHAYLLIEDDVFDRDEMRRGGKTLHVAIADAHPKWPGGADHYGMSQGMLLAGLMSIWSREIVLESSLPARQKLRLLRRMESMLEDTHFGEMLDILISGTEHVTERDVLLVHLLKTARYTFVAPLQMGVMLAGATQKELKALEQFGVPLGIAFQMQDDYLGVFGTEQQIGKSVTSDLEEKKKTLLVLYAQEHLRGKQKKAFLRLLAKATISKRDAARIRSQLILSGAPEVCQTIAKTLVEQAKTVLTQRHGFAIPTTDLLNALADFVIRRNR